MQYDKEIRNTSNQPRTNLTRLLLLLTGILLVFQVVASNRLATVGMSIAQAELDINELTQENNDLRQEIASASALLTIREKAKAFGFTKTTQPVYYHKDLPVALEF